MIVKESVAELQALYEAEDKRLPRKVIKVLLLLKKEPQRSLWNISLEIRSNHCTVIQWMEDYEKYGLDTVLRLKRRWRGKKALIDFKISRELVLHQLKKAFRWRGTEETLRAIHALADLISNPEMTKKDIRTKYGCHQKTLDRWIAELKQSIAENPGNPSYGVKQFFNTLEYRYIKKEPETAHHRTGKYVTYRLSEYLDEMVCQIGRGESIQEKHSDVITRAAPYALSHTNEIKDMGLGDYRPSNFRRILLDQSVIEQLDILKSGNGSYQAVIRSVLQLYVNKAFEVKNGRK